MSDELPSPTPDDLGGQRLPVENTGGVIAHEEHEEIERRYIVKPPPTHVLYPSRRITQGYAASGTRFRITTDRETGQVEYTRTDKVGSGISRLERTDVITREVFAREWGQITRVVNKIRYNIPHNDAMIELDVFEGALDGHAIAEVEFPSMAAAIAFTAPAWFKNKRGLTREVTDKKEYSNRALANVGWPGHK